METVNIFKQWIKETKRNGGVLVGSSIKEFLIYLQERLYTKEEIVKDIVSKGWMSESSAKSYLKKENENKDSSL